MTHSEKTQADRMKEARKVVKDLLAYAYIPGFSNQTSKSDQPNAVLAARRWLRGK